MLAYYPDQQVTLLYGGSVTPRCRRHLGLGRCGWRPVTEDGPPARFANFLVYDPARRNLVLYGGHCDRDGPLAVADTWLWDSRAGGRRPPTRTGPTGQCRAVFVPHRTRAAGRRQVPGRHPWTTCGPGTAPAGPGWPTRAPATAGAGLAYDPTRHALVLTGGLDQPGNAARHQDVWESAGTAFERVYPPD